MSRREIKEKLKQLKIEAATEIGRLQYIKENNDHYKGDLPSRVNGEQGGPIGGQMVKKMISSEMSKMAGTWGEL
ncbi:MAG TPA: alpha/beta-type small acid-soluble spore protein [Clostridiales bacterium]|jgi:hypothetical protein|nr:alpha/beta-type small acid-soluble spore protein [Clostridiales bacterium]